MAVYLDGSDQPDRAADGTPMLDDDFLVLVNAWWQPPGFTIPATCRSCVIEPARRPEGNARGGRRWRH